MPELIFEIPTEPYTGQAEPRPLGQKSAGAGILLNQEGYVITNHHVLGRTITAALAGRTETYAVLYSPTHRFAGILTPVAYSSKYDLALAKVKVPEQCHVSDTVIAEPTELNTLWVGTARMNDPASTLNFFESRIRPLITFDPLAHNWHVTQTAPLDLDATYTATIEHGYTLKVKSDNPSAIHIDGEFYFAQPKDHTTIEMVPNLDKSYVFAGTSGTPVFDVHRRYLGPICGDKTFTGENAPFTLPRFTGPKQVHDLIKAASSPQQKGR